MKPSNFRWKVLSLTFVVYLIAWVDRANIGIVLPYMRESFNLSNTEAGAIASLFFFAYAFCQLPSAFIVKKFGARIVLPAALFLTTVAAISHVLVTSVLALKFVRVSLGIFEAPVATACITSINNWFSKTEKGLAAGIFIASSKAGPVLVPPIGALIIYHFSWEYVFVFFALPGFILPLIWYFFVSDNPKDSKWVNKEELALISADTEEDDENTHRQPTRRYPLLDRLIRARHVPRITESKQVFLNWNIWGAALGYFLFIGTFTVILSWLPTYLKEEQGYDILKIGFVAAAPFVGAVIGNTFGGWVSDKLLDGRRKPLMMLSCVATVIMMHLLRSAPNDAMILSLILLMTGISLSLGFSMFSIYASGICDKSTFPVAVSTINTCGQLGGGSLPFIIGILLDNYNWDMVFAFLGFASLTALVLLYSIIEPRENHELS